MGCVSSKILNRSLSFQEEVKNRLKRRTKGVEELVNSNNGGDQLFALLRTAYPAVPRKIMPPEEPEKNSSSLPVDHNESDVEIINTWELLAGLDEEKVVEHQKQQSENDEHNNEEYKFIVSDGSSTSTSSSSVSAEKDKEEKITRSRSIHTVEEFDAMEKEKQENEDRATKSNCRGNEAENEITSRKGAKRKALAKDLAALKVPAFEFTKTGSLREWIQRGGQVTSPGSYVTPKFGNFAAREPKFGKKTEDDLVVFDPEMVAQFEQAMIQLATDEEFVLRQIVERSG
ncbi:hypothetical protein Cni_G20842 [Canna indica]|uniref:Uncharacterized protein n=1 Tax=Canna indica TaxID=4628 RepID=A0AAQ3KNC7_9LILI|nr:hypothetical protein Cni_G20842 [Canna indica]